MQQHLTLVQEIIGIWELPDKALKKAQHNLQPMKKFIKPKSTVQSFKQKDVKSLSVLLPKTMYPSNCISLNAITK